VFGRGKSASLEIEFQSLLCWIMVCKQADPFPSLLCIESFNPCYVGLWSVRIDKKAIPLRGNLFQSLLCWIMVCKTIYCQEKLSAKSFNPCYVGLWSVSGRGQIQGVENSRFQSLLCWIMVCKSVPTR